MNKFLSCAVYLALTGVLVFLLGRILPKRWFNANKFPFRPYVFEKYGKIYDGLKIRLWQSKVPDMSRLFSKIMPPKNLSGDYEDRLDLMISETCIAEFIHILHSVLGLYCLKYGVCGCVLTVANAALLNLPFILIQRYNRPRLVRLCGKIQNKKDVRCEQGI